ncbi:MAG: hypothetical protein ACOYVJ_02010 [Nitrospirota bacterium]
MPFKKRMTTKHRAEKKEHRDRIEAPESIIRRLFRQSTFLRYGFHLFALSSILFALCFPLRAEIRDRVVASIDNTAITLSDLEEKYAETVTVLPDVTRTEVLNTMINRLLLVREAHKIRLEASSQDELLREYIDLKIRAFIRIRDEDALSYFEANRAAFGEKQFDEVREEIEHYLTERELNNRIRLHIAELKEKACINIRFHENR